jgi:tetratricopeptide (TPR) repeat protein
MTSQPTASGGATPSQPRPLSRLLQLLLLGALPLVALPLRADTAAADKAFQSGHADDATTMLRSTLSTDPRNAKAHQLLCRVFYAQDRADEAVRECESAVNISPEDSDNHLWLARAYGQKATRVNMVSAFSIAKKVHAAFEEAARLDPSNLAALDDLGEFYVNAPGIVGGGVDKAERLDDRLRPLSDSKAHRLQALIAEKKGDLVTAEAEFKHAVDAGHSPEAYVDLGFFYQRQKRYDESEAALDTAVQRDRAHDNVLVDAASILISAHRDPHKAESLLRTYLASPAKSEAAPAFHVHVQLGDLLAADGDKDAARHEYEQALALAANYAPAKKAMAKL